MTPASTFAALGRPHSACVVSVAIPARDEATCIGPALDALAAQRSSSGAPLDPRTFEILVFANDCSDDTSASVLAFAARHPLVTVHLVDAPLPPGEKHIGFARRAVMNAAAARMRGVGTRGIVASTDADTRVGPEWISRTVAELRSVDALGGRVLPEALGAREQEVARARTYALEHRYQYAVVRLETLLDPVACDPWPRHGNHQGASFALRAEVYTLVGGTPAVPLLEDFALYDALMRAGARFRHSLRVRVLTSSRRTGRVRGGFASHLQAIDEHVAGRALHLVEHPSDTFARLLGRGALRRDDSAAAAAAYGLSRETVVRHLCEATALGAALEAIEHEARIIGRLQGRPRVRIEQATRDLENYRSMFSSRAALPTRIKA